MPIFLVIVIVIVNYPTLVTMRQNMRFGSNIYRSRTRPLSRHKPPLRSISRRQSVIFVAAPVFREAAASRFLGGLNRLVAKVSNFDAIDRLDVTTPS